MVKKYCDGTLDKKNTWLFNYGNIKVVPHQYKKSVKLKTEEEKSIDKEIAEKGKATVTIKIEENNNDG